MKPVKTFLKFVLLTIVFSQINTVFAEEPISKDKKTHVFIDGYDTVAYHDPQSLSEHKAHKGSEDLTVEWKGAIFRFASAENHEAFLTDPERYSPAYNGHCANALSLGEGLYKTDGTHWEIYNDQLYLFYKDRGRLRWNDGNWESYKVDADKAWLEILAEQ